MLQKPSVIVALLLPISAVAAPSAQLSDGRIVVTGLASSKGLSVVVAEGTDAEIAARPAMSGEWTDLADKLTFAPKYPLRPGTRYRVLGSDTPLEVLVPKAAPAKPTIVTGVHPSATELPENVFRFYIQFNQPMPRGESYRYVDVLTEKGEKVEWPFLQQDDELWNADQTRLTLFIDPGRIKKEVKPRIDLGPVFIAKNKYTLVINGKWPTLDGGTLGTALQRSITITAPINEAIEPKNWKMTPPVNRDAPLKLTFDRPLDHALLMRSMSVVDADGKAVAGTGKSVDHDRGWSFLPARTWAVGKYNLRVATILEDVCGNRIGQPFEIDLSRPTPKEVKAEFIDLPFAVSR